MAVMQSHLAMGRLKMNLIEDTAKNSLLTLVEKIEGSKVLIWDQELMGPVTLLRATRQLKELHVEEMHSLYEDGPPNIRAQNVIFIVRPNISQMKLVADYVHALTREDQKRTSRREYSVLFIPRVTQMCERELKTRGVYGSVDLKSTNIYMFPFDTDLMSMEIDHTFREFVVENDPSKLIDAAVALKTIDAEYGPFPHIIGRGPAAKIVADQFLELVKLEKYKSNVVPAVHHVVIIDRQVDLITPLATQLTYEGLIDEIFGLNNTTAQLPPEPFAKDDDEDVLSFSPSQKKLVYLNSADELYAELRDRNFNGVGPHLRKKAQYVAQQIEKRHDKTMENMKKFLSQLPQLQAAKKSLALHMTIAELIKAETDRMDFLDGLQTQQEILCAIDTDRPLIAIEDAISKKIPLLQALRLICLQSLINGGLKPKLFEHYKRELVHTYGAQLLIPLTNLEKAGLFKLPSPPKSYAALKRMLRLIVEDDSEIDPTDICYTHSIYAPLSVRLIQNFKNWSTIKDVIDLVEGPTVEHAIGKIPVSTKPDEKQLVLVFFIGGCTQSEVAALRFLSQRDDSDVEYIIATTKLINGNTFLKSVMGARNCPDLDIF